MRQICGRKLRCPFLADNPHVIDRAKLSGMQPTVESLEFGRNESQRRLETLGDFRPTHSPVGFRHGAVAPASRGPGPPRSPSSEVPRRPSITYSPLLAGNTHRSITRLEYPHSLSYQATTFTKLPPMTFVGSESTIELIGFFNMCGNRQNSPRKGIGLHRSEG